MPHSGDVGEKKKIKIRYKRKGQAKISLGECTESPQQMVKPRGLIGRRPVRSLQQYQGCEVT